MPIINYEAVMNDKGVVTGFKQVKESIDDTGESSKKTETSVGLLGTAMGVAAGIGIAELGKLALEGFGQLSRAALDAALEIDEAFDTIRIKTGATGEEAEKLQQSFKNVFKGVPSDAAAVSTAIAELNSRLDLSGAPLEKLSTQLLNLSRMTGTDLKGNIGAVSTAFKNWGVDTGEQSDKLDMLFKISQSTGVGVDKLATSVTQGGAALQALGFDFDTAAVLMGSFEKAGIDTGSATQGLKKALVEMAKDGISDAKAGFEGIIEKIKSAKTETEATGLAAEAFGSRSAVAMSKAIRDGNFELDAMVTLLKESPETINQAAADTEDFAEKWQIVKNNVTLALEPIGTQMMGALTTLTGGLADASAGTSLLADAFAAPVKLFYSFSAGVNDVVASLLEMVGTLGTADVAFGKLTDSVGLTEGAQLRAQQRTEDFSLKIANAKENAQFWRDKLTALDVTLNKVADVSVPAATKATQAHEKAVSAAAFATEAHKKELAKLTEEVTKATNPAGELEKKLQLLKNAHADDASILIAYKDDVKKLGELYEAQGKPLPPLVANLREMQTRQDALKDSLKDLLPSLTAMQTSFEALEKMRPEGALGGSFISALKDLGVQVDIDWKGLETMEKHLREVQKAAEDGKVAPKDLATAYTNFVTTVLEKTGTLPDKFKDQLATMVTNQADVEKSLLGAWEKYVTDAAAKHEKLPDSVKEKIAAMVENTQTLTDDQLKIWEGYKSAVIAAHEGVPSEVAAKLVVMVADTGDLTAQQLAAWKSYLDDVKKEHESVPADVADKLAVMVTNNDTLTADQLQIWKDYIASVKEAHGTLPEDVKAKLVGMVADTKKLTEDQRQVWDDAVDLMADDYGKLPKATKDANDKVVKQSQDAAKSTATNWKTEISTITNDWIKGLADILVDGKDWGKKFADIAKETGKSFLRTFLDDLLAPAKKAMDDWLGDITKQFTGWIKGLFSGGSAAGGQKEGFDWGKLLGAGIAAGAMIGLGKLADWVASLFKKDPVDSGVKEIIRDLGLDVSTKALDDFVKKLGLTNETFKGIRKDILSSPKFFQEIAVPAAEAAGSLDKLYESASHIATAWGTFDFSEGLKLGVQTGDWTLLNEQYVAAFGNSKALVDIMPDFADKLAAVTDEAVVTRQELEDLNKAKLDAAIAEVDKLYAEFLELGELTTEFSDLLTKNGQSLKAFTDGLDIAALEAEQESFAGLIESIEALDPALADASASLDDAIATFTATGVVTDTLRDKVKAAGGDIGKFEEYARIKDIKDSFADLRAEFEDTGIASDKLRDIFTEFGGDLELLNQGLELTNLKKSRDAFEDFRLELEAVAPPAQTALDIFRETGEITGDLADEILRAGGNLKTFEEYAELKRAKESFDELVDSFKKTGVASDELIALIQKYGSESDKTAIITIDNIDDIAKSVRGNLNTAYTDSAKALALELGKMNTSLTATIDALTAKLTKGFDDVADAINTAFTGAGADLKAELTKMNRDLSDTVINLQNALTTAIRDLKDAMLESSHGATDNIDDIQDSLDGIESPPIANDIISELEAAANYARAHPIEIKVNYTHTGDDGGGNSSVRGYASGGPVDRTGLAYLHAGEYVMTADAMRAAFAEEKIKRGKISDTDTTERKFRFGGWGKFSDTDTGKIDLGLPGGGKRSDTGTGKTGRDWSEKDLAAEIARLTKETGGLTKSSDRAKIDLDNNKFMASLRQKTVDAYKYDLDLLSGKKKIDLDKKLKDLEDSKEKEAETYDKSRAKYEADINELRELDKYLTDPKELDANRIALVKLQGEFDDATKAHTKAIEKYNADISDTKDELDGLSEKLVGVEERLAANKDAYELAQSELDEYNGKLGELTDASKAASDAFTDNKTTLLELQAEYDRLTKKGKEKGDADDEITDKLIQNHKDYVDTLEAEFTAVEDMIGIHEDYTGALDDSAEAVDKLIQRLEELNDFEFDFDLSGGGGTDTGGGGKKGGTEDAFDYKSDALIGKASWDSFLSWIGPTLAEIAKTDALYIDAFEKASAFYGDEASLAAVIKKANAWVGINAYKIDSGKLPDQEKASTVAGGGDIFRIPSYGLGGYVPRTGPALLHQGERVLTAAEAAASVGDTINVYLSITNNAVDAAGVDTLTQEKIIPSLVSALETNRKGARVNIKQGLGIK